MKVDISFVIEWIINVIAVAILIAVFVSRERRKNLKLLKRMFENGIYEANHRRYTDDYRAKSFEEYLNQETNA